MLDVNGTQHRGVRSAKEGPKVLSLIFREDVMQLHRYKGRTERRCFVGQSLALVTSLLQASSLLRSLTQKMKLVRLAWVLALFQLPWGMHAQQPGNSSASASIALAIQEGLTRLNLTAAARLAVNASVSLIPKLSVPHPQTLLVPTNEAIAAAAPALASADNASIGAILS